MALSPQMVELANAARDFASSSSTAGPIATAKARLTRALVLCVRAAAVKEIANTLPNPLKDETITRADLTINNIIDDYCGTAVPFVPWPWPSPSPPALELATQLTIFANMFVHSGPLRTEIAHIAGRLAKKAYDTDGLK